MANITYDYPYLNGMFNWDWGSSNITLNGNYTSAGEFKAVIPNCSKFVFTIYVYSNSITVFNRSWDLFVYSNSSWYEVGSFTLPNYTSSDGTTEKYSVEYTVEMSLSPTRNISKFACVPSSILNRAYTWAQAYSVYNPTITEDISEAEAVFAGEFCGIGCKGCKTDGRPAGVMVNIDGELVSATEVYTNQSGELVPVKKAVQYAFKAEEKEERILIGFKGIKTGMHHITSEGDNAPNFKVLDSEYQPITSSFGIEQSIELEADKQYYLLAIDEPWYTELADSLFKIYV